MYDAVHNGKSPYSEAQRNAWVPEPRSGETWNSRLEDQDIVLQEQGARIDGFMSLTPDGYVDFAYIRPPAQGSGLFKKLYARLEAKAMAEGQTRLWVHASLAAKPAFSAVGFSVCQKEQVEISGEALVRYEMEKILRPES